MQPIRGIVRSLFDRQKATNCLFELRSSVKVAHSTPLEESGVSAMISEEEREKRRQRILRIRPWERSTGPKTELGKLMSSQNSTRHGLGSASPVVRQIARIEKAAELKTQQLEKIRSILAAYAGRRLQPPDAIAAVEQFLRE